MSSARSKSAAAVASLALYTRQPLLIAYIVLGALIGPYGLALITTLTLLQDIAHVGIIFLLFLLTAVLNNAVGRINPRWALSPGDCIHVYIIQVAASAVQTLSLLPI